MGASTEAFIRLVRHPLRFRMFLLMKLPSAWFSGVRVREISETHCITSVPYKWFSQNPFSSTYFACLAMAAELSTGALAMAHVYKRKPAVSMLVVSMNAVYHKKATARTFFTCNDGGLFNELIQRSVETGEGVTFEATSTGRNAAGELIAVFTITWSFKARKNIQL